MFKDFKAFVMRGNVLDLAIAVILGASFGAIVTSVVNDIVMPPIGLVLHHVDFNDLFVCFSRHAFSPFVVAKAAAAPVIAYGQFLNTVFNFLIVSAVIFVVVKQVSKLHRKPEAAPAAPTTKDCAFCCTPVPLAATRCPHCTSQLEAAAH